MVRVANELRQPAQLWTVAAAKTTLALSHGRFVEAAEQIEQAAVIGGRAIAWSALATRRIQLFMLRREQGTLAGFEREIEDYPHEFPSPLMHGAVLAHVYAQLHRTADAEALVRELTARDLSNWHVDEEWLVSVCLLAETCAMLDDAETAGPLYELLLPYGSAERRRACPNSRSTPSAGRSAPSRTSRAGSTKRRNIFSRRCR